MLSGQREAEKTWTTKAFQLSNIKQSAQRRSVNQERSFVVITPLFSVHPD